MLINLYTENEKKYTSISTVDCKKLYTKVHYISTSCNLLLLQLGCYKAGAT